MIRGYFRALFGLRPEIRESKVILVDFTRSSLLLSRYIHGFEESPDSMDVVTVLICPTSSTLEAIDYLKAELAAFVGSKEHLDSFRTFVSGPVYVSARFHAVIIVVNYRI